MSLRHRLRKGVFRRGRALVASPRLWRSRLVFWAGALATGLVSVAFAVLADRAQGLFRGLATGDGWHLWLPLLLTPLGMVACAVLADRYFPGSQGSGIPQAIAARHLRTDEERHHLLSLRMVLGKVGLTIAGLASGASIGREGPTVQVGASLMMMSARVGGMSHSRGLILAGSAAGIAAAFNTPLAGIVFAIEEMSRSYQSRTNGVILSAVIIAGVASLALLGSYSYFGVLHEVARFPDDWLLVILCGVLGGFCGAMFSRAVLWLTRRIRNIRAVGRMPRLMLVALAAGLVVAGLGIGTHGMTFGTSYEQARAGIEGASLPWYFFPAKFLATLASTVAGIPGGLFAPSLAVGVGLGSVIGTVLGSGAGLAAVLGMSGYFAGVVQAPMTAFVIILEMTGNHANIVPIMASAMLGYGTARLVAREPLYHALSRLWAADVLRKVRAAQAAQAARAETAGQPAG